jgi:hypothetical protein
MGECNLCGVDGHGPGCVHGIVERLEAQLAEAQRERDLMREYAEDEHRKGRALRTHLRIAVVALEWYAGASQGQRAQDGLDVVSKALADIRGEKTSEGRPIALQSQVRALDSTTPGGGSEEPGTSTATDEKENEHE